MSIMGDEKQLTIEKLRDYPSITVEDRSLSTTPAVSSTSDSINVRSTTELLNKPSNHQLSIVATTGNQNIELETTHTELKQAVDRKVPPYTSIGSTTRTVRPVIKITERTSMVEKSKILSNCQFFSPIEVSEENRKIDKSPKKHGEKTVSGQFANKDSELNSTEHKNIQALSQAVGKNIQKNVLSLTPISSTAKVTSTNCITSTTAIKEGNVPKFMPSIPKETVKRSILATVKKQIDLNLKSNPASPSNNVKEISVINSFEKNRIIVNKSVTEEVSSSTIKPRIVTKSLSNIIENSTGNCNETVTPKIVTSPVISRSKSTAVQVNITNSCQKAIEETVVRSLSTSPSASTKRVKLHQLSSLNDDSNKAVLDALNSGSNVHTGSVTVSKQPSPGQTVKSVLSKPIVELGDSSSPETAGQSKFKQFNLSSPPGNIRISEKVTDTIDKGLNVSLSPTSNVIISSSTPADNAQTIGLNAPSSLLIKSESAGIYCENNVFEKKHDEPECLTISSDEEEDKESVDFEQVISSSHTSELSVSIMSKEPTVQKSEPCDSKIGDETMSDTEIDEALEETTAEGYFSLLCRTIRIGSYKVSPRTPVIVSKYGLRLVVPSTTSSESVVLKIPSQRIRKVLIHFGRTLPVVFYYLHPAVGMKIRQILNMHDPATAYFDPTSTNDTHKRITLLPEKFSDVHEMCFRQVYPGDDKLEKLSQNEANALLLRSVPREARDKIQKVSPNPVQAIMVYPPPPAIGGISINTEDYSCLAEDVFLNDVIIDFYLKYLYLQMSDEDRQKIHIFSSFFYKRLTDKATPLPRHLQSATKSADSVISAAEIRHNRVKNWTKNIDLFSKDFIVIPLNENQHWFLAVICFPGLKGPIRFSDNTPITTRSKKMKEVMEGNISEEKQLEGGESNKTITIGSTTITPLKGSKASALVAFLDDNDVEERDEAEATDEEVNINSSCEDTDEEGVSSEIKKEVVEPKPRREPIKQPCILIFDSLAGASRARIIATLREYLKVEYKIKHGEDRDFSKNVVKGAVPRVPQQDNYTDCGLFVLQYVEHFLQYKISDYRIPIKTLRDWFDPAIVSHKRQQIQLLLLGLMQEQGIDIESLNLPKLNFSEEPSDYDEDDGMYDSDEYYERGSLYHYDIDYERVSHMRSQYEHDSDEDDYDMEDEDEMVQSRYGHLDSDEEMQNTDSDESDPDDIYKGLENPEVLKQKRYRQNLHRRMANTRRCSYGNVIDEAAEEGVDDEEEGVLRDDDTEDEQLSSEIEATLENVNRGSVSISRLTPKLPGIRTRYSGSVGVSLTNSPTTSKETILADLKSARPFGDVDSSGSEKSCPKKKFKPN